MNALKVLSDTNNKKLRHKTETPIILPTSVALWEFYYKDL